MPRAAALVFVLVAGLAAQDQAWNELLQQRVRDGQDLIELRYRRDAQGLLEVASCEGGARPFEPMFPASGPTGGRIASVWILGLLMLGQSNPDLLAMTDGERHLRRAGIDVTPVALRQFLLAPPQGGDAVRARIDLLDRMVAIDVLRRGGHRGAIAEFTALRERAGTEAPLAARAAAGLLAFGREVPAAPRRRLDPATLPLPATADGYLVIDHAALPDAFALQAIARRLVVQNSYRVVEVLRAPTPDDLYGGQLAADMLGETPFELVRRFGNLRLDHTIVAIAASPPGATLPFGWNAQTVGELESEPLTAAVEALVAGLADVRAERRDGALELTWPAAAVTVRKDGVATHSKSLGGSVRPDLARQLLAAGPALRAVVPATSKAWLGLAALKLPPAGYAELTASFGDEFRLRLSITARDEDAAEAWVERGRQLLAQLLEQAKALFGTHPDAQKDLQPLLDALASVQVSATGADVAAVLQSRQLGWATLRALSQLAR